MSGALDGLLVVALEQAVAAPLCTRMLADAGARVIKIERPEGDFARGYDDLVHGESSYFVWLNGGKQSVVLDLSLGEDTALLEAIIVKADILVQNLKPGALAKLGFSRERLRAVYPTLIIASISGFDEDGPYASRKAYDLLVQAESGLTSVTGGPDAPARVGVSVVDIATGVKAYSAILEALLLRARTGEGANIRISLFGTMAEFMSVPLLQHRGGKTPARVGLAHPSIAPYGVFRTRDGGEILISIQSDREWRILAKDVLNNATLAEGPEFATNVKRVARRGETDAAVAAVFAKIDMDALTALLIEHDIAFGRVNDVAALAAHPHLRQVTVETERGPVEYPAPSHRFTGATAPSRSIPRLGEHTLQIKSQFTSDRRKG
jgi:itaconate CoA-transferase